MKISDLRTICESQPSRLGFILNLASMADYWCYFHKDSHEDPVHLLEEALHLVKRKYEVSNIED